MRSSPGVSPVLSEEAEKFQAYSRFVSRTSRMGGDLLTAALELSAEVGELTGPIVKTRRETYSECLYYEELCQERKFECRDELADVLWCVQNLANAMGVTLEQLMVDNHRKLVQRLGEEYKDLTEEPE